jgi:hypothetical protein
MNEEYLNGSEATQEISLPICLPDSIDDSIYTNPASMEKLIVEVMNYVRNLENYDHNVISLRRGGGFGAADTDIFFRRFERNQYNAWILQYLVSFTSRLPMRKEIAEDLADPFDQFKSFLQYNIGLLNEEDVILTIFEYLKKRKIISPSNYKYFKIWLVNKQQAWRPMMAAAPQANREGWVKVFTVLKEYAAFWLSVRGDDGTMSRRGDLYMYHLTRLLLKIT